MRTTRPFDRRVRITLKPHFHRFTFIDRKVRIGRHRFEQKLFISLFGFGFYRFSVPNTPLIQTRSAANGFITLHQLSGHHAISPWRDAPWQQVCAFFFIEYSVYNLHILYPHHAHAHIRVRKEIERLFKHAVLPNVHTRVPTISRKNPEKKCDTRGLYSGG